VQVAPQVHLSSFSNIHLYSVSNVHLYSGSIVQWLHKYTCTVALLQYICTAAVYSGSNVHLLSVANEHLYSGSTTPVVVRATVHMLSGSVQGTLPLYTCTVAATVHMYSGSVQSTPVPNVLNNGG